MGLRLSVPELPRPMRNPIGAGDAVSSGTLLGWCGAKVLPLSPKNNGKGADLGISIKDKWEQIRDAFSWGLACGAASCMGDANSVFLLDEAEALCIGIHTESF